MGYQRLFRWESGIASRGKMMGMTFAQPVSIKASLPRSPTDPLMQDLAPLSRKYLCYCKIFPSSKILLL